MYPYYRGIGGTFGQLPLGPPPDPPGTNVFYVSNTGSDSNPGTKAAPWKTLAFAATARTWSGNDTLALRGNGTWNEPLNWTVNGSYAGATYDSVYASTFSAANTAYLASSIFTNFKNTLIAAGQSSGTATTNATEYCRRLAIRDAVNAATIAGKNASSWVRLTRYDVGVNPVIAPGGSVNAGVLIDPSSTAGFYMSNVDVKNCQAAGVYFQPTSHSTRGFIVENCKFANITGMPLPPGGGDNNPRVPGFFNAWAVPVGTEYVQNVSITGCNSSGCDASPFVWFAFDALVDSNIFATTFYQAFDVIGDAPSVVGGTPTTRMVFTNNVMIHQQINGWPNGTGSIQLSGCVDCYIGQNNISLTQTSGDGVALDWEAFCTNCLAEGNTFINNPGSPMLMSQSANILGAMIVGNTFTNNGSQGFATNVAFVRADATSWIAVNNKIKLIDPSQALFSGTSHSFPPNVATNTVPTGCTFGPDNIVT